MAEVQSSFTPIDYDAETIPPDAPAGAWQAVATSKISKTSKDSYPMVIVEWELETAYDEENESFQGARVADFITFFPESHRANKMSKVRLRQFCDKLGISRTLIPKHIGTPDDLAEFCGAIDGQKADIWTVIETQAQDSGESIDRVKVLYKQPGAVAALPPVTDTDDEEEEEEEEEEETAAEAAEPQTHTRPKAVAAAAPKTNGTAKTANGTASKKKVAGRR